jgi:lipopolysaccharide export system permease protein
VKIINRYVLKEHIGPFVFALSALTSLLLLQVIARKFGDLVGRGLSWQTITEFFLLSFPYTMAMTFPMAVLVAVLYAFSRLASENEITALKAGGVSARSLLAPTLVAALGMSIFMLWFNDQLLSRANHELATLQMAIARTKPTFALKEQIINPVKEGQLYLRAGEINRDESGRMRDVTIYDVSDASRRRTIFADSGTLVFAANKHDLIMHLYSGMVMSAPTSQAGQLDRIYYHQDIMKIRDVLGAGFTKIDADTASKGEREMDVCEMQRELDVRVAGFQRAYQDSLQAAWRLAKAKNQKAGPEPTTWTPRRAGGIGDVYCKFLTNYWSKYVTNPVSKYVGRLVRVRSAQAAEIPASMRAPALAFALQAGQGGQDTSKKLQDTTKKAQDTTKKLQDTTKKAAVQDTTKKALLQDTAKKLQDTVKKAAAPTKQLPLPGDSVTALIGSTWKRVLFRDVPPGAFVTDTVGSHPINIGMKPATPGVPGFIPNPALAPSVGGNGTPVVPPPGGVNGQPPPGTPTLTPGTTLPPGSATSGAAPIAGAGMQGAGLNDPNTIAVEVSDSKIRLDEARHWRNRYDVEIQKKFSLAASCIVFVLIGAPIALRFPRGGVGLVMGVGLVVFAIYYIGLIGGEALSDHGIISPVIAMWADNMIFLVIGLGFISRMGNEGVTGRGGNVGEIADTVRRWFLRSRGVAE